MFRTICLVFVISVGSTVSWSQVEPSATGGSGSSDDSYMTMQPQVSGSFYSSSVGNQQRSNELSAGVIVGAGYDDNLLAGEASNPVSGETYTVFPSVAIAEQRSRTHASLSYHPGFIFYRPTSSLDTVNQSLSADFSFRVSPRTTVTAQDVFAQNSSVFNQPYTIAGGTVSGSTQNVGPIVILPYADQITDTTQGSVGYQFGRNSMIGGGGTFSIFRFTNSNQDQGLFDSQSYGGSAFFSQRISRGQYLGIRYGYTQSTSDSGSTTIDIQDASVLYTFEIGHSFSLSLSGGPQYYVVSNVGIPSTQTWSPSGGASLGWQGRHTDVAFSYARSVSTGWGLLGAYSTDSGSASVEHELSRRLSGELSGNYANVQNESAAIAGTTQSGHTIFGRASLRYQLAEHLTVQAGYVRLHENFAGIAEVANNPDADRVELSFNYEFRRPLGK